MTAALTPRQRQIMTLLRKAPHGLRIAEIAEQIGLGKHRTRQVLRELRKLGEIAPTNTNFSARWALRSIAEAIIAVHQQTSAIERRAARDRRRAAVRAAREKAFQQERERAWLWPTRRVVSAADAAPIRTQAPRSVFELGGRA